MNVRGIRSFDYKKSEKDIANRTLLVLSEDSEKGMVGGLDLAGLQKKDPAALEQILQTMSKLRSLIDLSIKEHKVYRSFAIAKMVTGSEISLEEAQEKLSPPTS